MLTFDAARLSCDGKYKGHGLCFGEIYANTGESAIALARERDWTVDADGRALCPFCRYWMNRGVDPFQEGAPCLENKSKP